MWKPIIMGKVGSRVAPFFLTKLRQCSKYGVKQRRILLASSHANLCIITPLKIHYFWDPWCWILSTILGYFWWGMSFFLQHYFPLFCASLWQNTSHVAACLMEALWLSPVLKMLEDIHHLCPIVKDLMGSVITAFNPLAAHRCVLCRKGCSF